MARIAIRENPEPVSLEILGRIAEAAQLPDGDICLLVGDPLLGDDHQACCVPRAFIRSYGDIAGLEAHLEDPWDCGVIVGSKWAIRQPEFPAYFAYLLGHEFGHATTVLTRLWLAAYEAMIFDIPALSDRDDWRWDEMPHELRYDQFGLAVADQVYGLERLQVEIERLLQDGLERDEQRLRRLLVLPPRLDLSGLDADIADFALPYREALLAKWRTDAKRGAPGMGRYLSDLDYLWSGSR